MTSTRTPVCWGLVNQMDGVVTLDLTPTPLMGAPGDVRDVRAGHFSGCLLSGGGRVSCWGYAPEAGLPSDSREPLDVPGVAPDVTAIAVGNAIVCAASPEGLSCWGDWEGAPRGPTAIQGVDAPLAQLVAGNGSACARDASGRVLCWGANEAGELGGGDVAMLSGTEPVVIPLAAPATDVSASPSHVCAVIGEGDVFCWGSNQHGELGTPADDALHPPQPIDGLPAHAVAVAAGYSFTCSLLSDASVWCWGDNGYDQLGSSGGPPGPRNVTMPPCP